MTAVTPATTTASVTARIERLPTSRWHIKVRSLIGAVTFFEAFNQLLIASALPQLIKLWHLTPGQSTFLVTSGSIGMLLGALIAGWLGDHIGRVRLVVIGTALTGLTGLVLVSSPSLAFFEWLRFIQGIGIGGVVPVAATYINEIIRAKGRGRFVLLYELVFPFGLTIAALVAYWVVPHWGWRALFLDRRPARARRRRPPVQRPRVAPVAGEPRPPRGRGAVPVANRAGSDAVHGRRVARTASGG